MKTKTNTKDSLLEVGKHLSSGVLGMVAGSAVGRYSLAIGALTIFGGAYYGKDWITSAGVGMAFSNGFGRSQSNSEVNGFKDNLEEAKERAITSLKAIGKKLYLDKLSPTMAQKMALGNLEDRPLVFMGSEVADTGDFDTAEVDEIIRRIEAGEPLPTADIQQGFTNGYDTVNGIDSMELNGGEDITELNAVA